MRAFAREYFLALSLALTAGKIFALSTPLDARSTSAPDLQTLTVSTTTTLESHFGLAVFIENNINYGTDGGIYAELIRNRAFQEGSNSTSLGHGTTKYWQTIGNASFEVTHENQLSPQLPTSGILSQGKSPSSATYGVRNVGFFGIPVKKQDYAVSFYARTNKTARVKFTAGLYDESGRKAFATADVVAPLTHQWRQFNVSIKCDAADQSLNNTFGLDVPKGSPDIQLQFISMFPPTWEGTVARQDIAEVIADLKPVYFRLPGGNSLEGNSLKEHFVWNNSVGPLLQRQGRKGTWAGWDTDGYGLNEAYELFTKMGAKPVLDVFAAHTLNNKSVPESQLQPYVDSVIDEMHYLLDAPGSSDLAKKRAQDGQREPWILPYVEIGNEDYLTGGNKSYNEYRYDAFSSAVAKAAPNVTPVSTSPYYTPKSKLKAIDQHDYNVPKNLISRWDERDSWPRNGTTVAELEFSNLNSGLCSEGSNIYKNACRLKVPTLIGAIAEATFMMGFERNGDITFSAAYAPLLDHADHSQWTPDLIKFNALEVVKSTSYYVQQAFGHNRIALSHKVTSSAKPGPVYWSIGTVEGNSKSYVVKLTNVGDSDASVRVRLDGGKTFKAQGGKMWAMNGTDKQAHNDIGKADVITPKTRALTAKDFSGGALSLTLPPYAFAVATIQGA